MLAVFADQHGLRRRRAAVEADDAAHVLARLERGRDELRDLVELPEVAPAPARRRTSGGPGLLAEARLAPVRDELAQAGDAVEAPDARRLVRGRRSPRRTPRSARAFLRHEDQLLDRDVLRVVVAALAHVCGMRRRQQSCRNGRYVFGPPSSSTRGFSVLPRVSTLRFCSTIASASEQSTSSVGMPLLTRLTMSVSANTPHLAATWCSFESSKRSEVAKPGRR